MTCAQPPQVPCLRTKHWLRVQGVGMQINAFLAQTALAHATRPFAALQAAFSDARPTYSRDAQDDEPIGQDNGMGVKAAFY